MKPESSNLEPLPLSLIDDDLCCPRRVALKIVEGWRSGNEHTVRGARYRELVSGVEITPDPLS